MAMKLMKDVPNILATNNIRLHKILSNGRYVMESLFQEYCAIDIQNLEFTRDVLHPQKSLGI